MSTLLMREQFINSSRGCHFGETEPEDTYTDDIGKLFRNLRREYGRATKIYLDTKSRGLIHIGWCFTKRMKYEDARGNDPDKDYYTREVWVSFFESCDLEDPLHVTSSNSNGSVTHHPFKTADLTAWKRGRKTKI